jgi:predicted phosphate transport protein (TIGR00153 family)
VLGWFRRLIPQSGDFFNLFERHAAACMAAAEALEQLTRGEGDRDKCIAVIRDQEHAADEIIREVLFEVRQTFLTPFDRTAITGLIGAMDDTIDEIQSCASAIELYEYRDFGPEMKTMAAEALNAVRLIVEALPLLRDIARNGHRLHELTARIVTIEGQVDVIHMHGLQASYAAARKDGDTLAYIVAREIYKHLERIADEFEDVANHIDGLVIDHS